jgi:hypothetical protein
METKGNSKSSDAKPRESTHKKQERVQREGQKGKAVGFKVFEPTTQSTKSVYSALHP